LFGCRHLCRRVRDRGAVREDAVVADLIGFGFFFAMISTLPF